MTGMGAPRGCRRILPASCGSDKGVVGCRERPRQRGGSMTGPRFKPIPPEQMTPEQKRVVQALTDGPRDRVRVLGDYVRFETSLPASLRELAILVVARFWSAQYEWYAHRQHAVKAGL